MHIANCVHMYEQGFSLGAIAKAENTSTSWVSRILQRIAIHQPGKRSDKYWTSEEDAVIVDLSKTAKEEWFAQMRKILEKSDEE